MPLETLDLLDTIFQVVHAVLESGRKRSAGKMLQKSERRWRRHLDGEALKAG
jgi:hypothetical protein